VEQKKKKKSSKKKKKYKPNEQKNESKVMGKKKIVPLVTLEKSNVTNGTSIGNVGIFQH
jgi:hypothetical protein